MSLTVQHLNSCVYEIKEINKDGVLVPAPLTKQTNNAIPILGYCMRRAVDTTITNIIADTCAQFKCESGDLKIMRLYPSDQMGSDEIGNFTIIEGMMVDSIPADPNKPIVVKGTEEEQYKARLEALQAKDYVRPFVMIAYEHPEYMFDISISHIPAGAIHHIIDDTKLDDINDDLEGMPLSIDPTGIHLGDFATPTTEHQCDCGDACGDACKCKD